ncbi:hypothetical protein [Paenibacillus sp. CF384]|uniref:hypothetical protein n=1 Tax=Paenibacillus sp. CF384 TaxID=1884382 RepID=UPI00089BE211|nr:hypothetical protein [Paenibacillus sp. CF384]SDW47698.1 hypothetical protein SAMN05518855_1002276 [Paenibacillus sp. CF384]
MRRSFGFLAISAVLTFSLQTANGSMKETTSNANQDAPSSASSVPSATPNSLQAERL